MNWYINRKTNEKVQGKLIDEHILSIRIDDYWELKDASQYGEAMVNNPMVPADDKPHIKDKFCDNLGCITYIPEQKQANEEPVIPICGTCNARKEQDLTKGELKFYNIKPDSSLLLSDEEICKQCKEVYTCDRINNCSLYKDFGGCNDFNAFKLGYNYALDHLAKLGIVYVKANDSSPVIEGNKDIIPVAEGYGFQISTVEEEAELGKKLISQEEYEECGDDEDMLIAQHNKTVKNMLAAGYKKFIPLSDYMKGEGE